MIIPEGTFLTNFGIRSICLFGSGSFRSGSSSEAGCKVLIADDREYRKLDQGESTGFIRSHNIDSTEFDQ